MVSALVGESGMTSLRRTVVTLSIVGSLLGMSAGCQTWVGGMTLPSPDYLKDKPDYIQPAPLYKHSKELASMERAMAEANPDANRYPTRNVQPNVAPVPPQQFAPVPAPGMPSPVPPGVPMNPMNP